MFRPGAPWLDTDGNPIQAHGGGILCHGGTFYWYGENKNGPTLEGWRVDVIGISCYSSKDLVHWRNEGVVLPSRPDDPDHDLHPSKVAERPKVLFNKSTGKFVMWLHIDAPGYMKGHAGVAIADSPTGPFTYLGSSRPHGHISYDMTLWQEEDGTAYLVHTAENHSNLHVVTLSDDYLRPEGRYEKILLGRRREAPALFKHEGTYYLVSSGCTGWDPNPTEIAAAPHPLGPWEHLGDPCTGPEAPTSYHVQPTFVLPVPGHRGGFIFMGDRWIKEDLRDSRYAWLPVEWTPGASHPLIPWRDAWSLEERGWHLPG